MKSFIKAGLLVFVAVIGAGASSAQAGCYGDFGCYDDYDYGHGFDYDHHDHYDVYDGGYDDCYEEHYHVAPVHTHIIHKPVTIRYEEHYDGWGCDFGAGLPW